MARGNDFVSQLLLIGRRASSLRLDNPIKLYLGMQAVVASGINRLASWCCYRIHECVLTKHYSVMIAHTFPFDLTTSGIESGGKWAGKDAKFNSCETEDTRALAGVKRNDRTV
jgi:hypothetical protein